MKSKLFEAVGQIVVGVALGNLMHDGLKAVVDQLNKVVAEKKES